ncbi:hypothetical protein N7471_011585 [Penicillium samsonianum]|uniref:uncharacterized protein n=1 Tax=Penicillium samsonianum TaxID=1882272 RepID=UPI0025478045|nr:uncharacterized protein N7471_011585 [Penicillium samsonianum]KAJ6124268.1 hypothetical protein N7471_011585 [Penicillium samsonianum]
MTPKRRSITGRVWLPSNTRDLAQPNSDPIGEGRRAKPISNISTQITVKGSSAAPSTVASTKDLHKRRPIGLAPSKVAIEQHARFFANSWAELAVAL